MLLGYVRLDYIGLDEVRIYFVWVLEWYIIRNERKSHFYIIIWLFEDLPHKGFNLAKDFYFVKYCYKLTHWCDG